MSTEPMGVSGNGPCAADGDALVQAEVEMESGGEAAAPEDDLAVLLEQEIALKEKHLAGWQRAQADLENLKKRFAREKAEYRAVVTEGFVRGMLPALDSLERATKQLKNTEGGEAVAKGLDLVMNMFLDFLEKEGIRPISAAGEPFDPRRHEAMLQVPTTEVEEGTVIEEIQRGYASDERVVRPALVAVARAPEAPPSDESEDGRAES